VDSLRIPLDVACAVCVMVEVGYEIDSAMAIVELRSVQGSVGVGACGCESIVTYHRT